jgi:UDP-2,4-diacetamido-2,4,6-trideoxy-beta-L-altropyranose hydrolase
MEQFNKNLIIRANAGTQMGSGHIMRCLALAQAWKDAGGDVTFITACEGDGLFQRLQNEKFDVTRLSNSYPDINDWDTMRHILHEFPGAPVLLDGYDFDDVYQLKIKNTGCPLIVIDDMARLKHYYADIVLNNNYQSEKLHYSCEPYTGLLLGIQYTLLRREFLVWQKWQRDIPDIAHRLLVTLGGGDHENYSLQIMNALQKLTMPDFEVNIVIGASNPHTASLERDRKNSRIPIRLIYDSRNMPELMAHSDIAIIAGGITLWELLFMGCTIISFDRNAYQEEIIRRMGMDNLLYYQGHINSLKEDSLLSVIKDLSIDSNKRYNFSLSGKQFIDGNGTKRVLSAINELNQS